MKTIKNIFGPKEEDIQLDMENIPRHVAIIMDGNGRWAKKRGLPRTAGHKAGIEVLREVIKASSELKIEFLTLYAFSTENWKRPKEEVSALMKLLVYYLQKEVKELHKNKVRIRTIGDITQLPHQVIGQIHKAVDLTKNNKGLTVNIALNYGGRDEIIRAVKNIWKENMEGNICIENMDEEKFSTYLDTGHLPDPDLLIRPSGEFRTSNFLLWQLAYAEFWFSNIYWPDFDKKHLYMAIRDYQMRHRRFGGLK
ncbi:MAG: isoprenyl transferase [Anaeromicrobium sp.]|jgi:undecaprenyl diphosphate synthase|uniref:isoprenyl transferase n=1 Tax=Anaeromicrobium sp. TaxID=1929132 RepID=UPI0025EFC363|nr:isoprenyl transferase [Anaeromicrobium sp.]MCT4595618.1 isoprenyl transferase [Anaeromicrobium sp.]